MRDDTRKGRYGLAKTNENWSFLFFDKDRTGHDKIMTPNSGRRFDRLKKEEKNSYLKSKSRSLSRLRSREPTLACGLLFIVNVAVQLEQMASDLA